MDLIKDKNQVDELLRNNVIMTSTDKLLSWFRSRSIFPVTFGLACCAIEMLNTSSAKFDFARFGYEAFRGSPRQADLMIVAGTITKKMQPLIARLYEQMAEPKYVMCMGSCAISGGPFTDSYHVVPGADTFLPVDVYIPGCPPRPEALIYGFLTLREKILHTEKWAKNNGERLGTRG
ncbi:MAG TPA: NADH-quinone oxidoreductase subunit B family protein [Desulfobacteria bacterium]|nr:NADH-quinone oxidoreductase subunit B family protein [Desulfobacteria bacterium]